MNVRAPLNPEKLADTWPKVEQSLTEAEAIERYLASITKNDAKKRDYVKPGRRWK